MSGLEVANEDGVEIDTFLVGKALKAGDVDCTKTGQGDVTGVVSDEDETGNIASLEAGGSENPFQPN